MTVNPSTINLKHQIDEEVDICTVISLVISKLKQQDRYEFPKVFSLPQHLMRVRDSACEQTRRVKISRSETPKKSKIKNQKSTRYHTHVPRTPLIIVCTYEHHTLSILPLASHCRRTSIVTIPTSSLVEMIVIPFIRRSSTANTRDRMN